MNRQANLRKNRGASTIVLMLVLAFFVILPLGLLGFEITRSFLIQQELRNITDSAALSGTAAMASSPEKDALGVVIPYATRQQVAMTAAAQTFEFNSILQTPFSATNVNPIYNPRPPSPQTPALHNATLNILLLDQTGAQVATGTPAATISVQSFYTDAPIFVSKILPVQSQFTLQSTSNGGLPQLDVILCLDISGSMDDQTNITFINRYWDKAASPAGQKMVYSIPTSSTGKFGQGVMFSVLVPAVTGTSLNIYPPQNLENATYQGAGANRNGFTWSETPDASAPAFTFSRLKGLRSNTTYPAGPVSMPEQGMPPGNYQFPATTVDRTNPVTGVQLNPKLQDPTGGFTDMIITMSFPQSVTTPQGTFIFDSYATEVEAQRGNMENLIALKSACGNTVPVAIGQPPKTGYFGAYETYVLQNALPISTARDAAYNFFNTMNISSNAHFGLVCFSTTPGTAPTDVFSDTNDNLSKAYPTGGTGTFPNPMVPLSKTNSNTQQFQDVTKGIEGASTYTPPIVYDPLLFPLRAEGSTDIAESLSTALGQLAIPGSALVRPTAKRAIVLFTDGVSNRPLPSAGSDALASLQGAAAKNAPYGVPIYTIGLSQNLAIQTSENNLLGDTAATPNGIAYLSGNNASYISVTNASQLDQAFQTIARSLCAIQ
jgi:hypothetical protein